MKFQKLTPTDNVDLSAYEEGFKFIFENEDIRNVAISGPYSSGKSSLLESYKAKYKSLKFLHISLEHFTDINKADSSGQNKENVESVIEGKILNQLIQQISTNNIPQMNFRIKKKINKRSTTLNAKIYNIDTKEYDVVRWNELENVQYFYNFFKKHEEEFL